MLTHEPPLESTSNVIFVKAYDYAWAFDTRRARQAFGDQGQILKQDPLLVQFDDHTIVVVFDYGAVVFFNYSEAECQACLSQLNDAVTRKNRIVSEDEFSLVLASPIQTLNKTEAITIEHFNLDVALVVSIVLSRSVSLEYYEKQVNNTLAKLEETVTTLALKGRVPRALQELTKQVGFGLSVDLELAYSVTILDDPDILWDSDTEVIRLYNFLKRDFDIQERILILREKLSIISRTSLFLVGRIETQRSLRLEWIIIFLILSEILLNVWNLA